MVVDSDDWLDVDALRRVMDKLEQLARGPEPLDLMICNYVYEHVEDGHQPAGQLQGRVSGKRAVYLEGRGALEAL